MHIRTVLYKLSDITNKGLPNEVLSKHHVIIWKIARLREAHRLVIYAITRKNNLYIRNNSYASNKPSHSTLPKIKEAGQENITISKTCPDLMKKRRKNTPTHTYITLMQTIQLYYYVTYN